MIRGVPLNRLPDGLQFPSELAGKVRYAEDKRQLQFEGFMSKTDFDKLVCLHNDLEYQRALERLFQVCTFYVAHEAREKRGAPMLLTGLAAAALLITMVACAVAWWH